jgi:hypothetical protein
MSNGWKDGGLIWAAYGRMGIYRKGPQPLDAPAPSRGPGPAPLLGSGAQNVPYKSSHSVLRAALVGLRSSGSIKEVVFVLCRHNNGR